MAAFATEHVLVGPGKIYIAPLGTSEPTDLATAWPSAWTQLGYTEAGSQFQYDLATTDVNAAESFDPIRTVPTGRNILVSFNMLEYTQTNLKYALAGGTITSGGGVVTFEPPSVGEITRYMLGWEGDPDEDGQGNSSNIERWVFRKCLSIGSVGSTRNKGAAAMLPVQFKVEAVTGSDPFKRITGTALS